MPAHKRVPREHTSNDLTSKVLQRSIAGSPVASTGWGARLEPGHPSAADTLLFQQTLGNRALGNQTAEAHQPGLLARTPAPTRGNALAWEPGARARMSDLQIKPLIGPRDSFIQRQVISSGHSYRVNHNLLQREGEEDEKLADGNVRLHFESKAEEPQAQSDTMRPRTAPEAEQSNTVRIHTDTKASQPDLKQAPRSKSEKAVEGGFLAKGMGQSAYTAYQGVNLTQAAHSVRFGSTLLTSAKGATQAVTSITTHLSHWENFLSIAKGVYATVGGYPAISSFTFFYYLKSVIDTYDEYKAFKTLESRLDGETDALADAANHGTSKVWRRFLMTLKNLASSAIDMANFFIATFGGPVVAGVAGLITLAKGVIEALIFLGTKLKGAWKMIRHTRGVHREQSARTTVRAALDNDPRALDLLHSLKPISYITKERYSITTPERPGEWRNFLRSLQENRYPDYGLPEFQKELADKWKSQ